MNLDKIFKAKSIAVIGASNRQGSIGRALMENLANSKYQGALYPVNPKRKTVHGIKTYETINNIEAAVDLAIIATPAQSVPGIVKECGQAGVAGIIVISAGFIEAGNQGVKMSKEIVGHVKKYGMRLIGPNCLGFIRPDMHINATFANKMATAGKIAFISQSGALGTAILDWSLKNKVGFRYFVSVGSMIDVAFHDLIDYFSNDPKVESILIYMESLTSARKFMSAARAFARSKPIIVLKAGRTQAGARAAKSHTGSITGNDAVFNAAFERAGIIRANTVVELFHVAKALSKQPRPGGKRMAVITNAGGPGIIATDALIGLGGVLANLEEATIKKLNKFLPPTWSRANPVDILGDAGPERYQKSLKLVLSDNNVDAVLVILTPQAMTDPTAVARELIVLAGKSKKTIMAAWMGGYDVARGREVLDKGNIPVYRQPEDAIRCFAHIFHYSEKLDILYETPATIPHAFKPKTANNQKLLDRVSSEKRISLNEAESKEFLSNYGIPIAKYKIVNSASDAGLMAKKIGFPVVMKILSADIMHKTDVGGVVLGVRTSAKAEEAYRSILISAKKKMPAAKIDGVIIEKQVAKRYEIIIGSHKDAIFGPVIVFGLGGVAVEVFNDIKIGLPPLNMALSLRLIEGTKVFKLLKGYRGMPAVDIQSIQFLLYKFSYLLADFPQIKEIDINPFGVDEKGGVVLDAKVILDRKLLGKKIKPYSHMVISPYPKEYVYKFTLKNKKRVIIRPIRPEDEPLEAELFSTFSPETQRHRFFKEIKEITHDLLKRYTQIDYDREIALIAEISANGQKKMIGVVRLIADPYNKTAEFAIVVGDPWQHLGLGYKFTQLILEIARIRKIKKVYAKYLKSNKLMEKIFYKYGFSINQLDRKTNYAKLDFKINNKMV